jgi:hypothetical protein
VSETNVLDPEAEPITLTSGSVVLIEPLRARQFFKLLRILTHAALPAMHDAGMFSSDNVDSSEFTSRLLSIVLLAIPDAEDETLDFVRSMCRPDGFVTGRRISREDRDLNDKLSAALDEELNNPELDDLVSIIEAIVRREAADIQALGKRVMGMFNTALKTGQIPSASPRPTSTDSTSSEDSAAPSTSSPPSTDGPTTPSSTSPSDGSDSA